MKRLMVMACLLVPAAAGVDASPDKPAVGTTADAGAVPVEFAGYVTIGGEQLFVLYDPEAKIASAWLRRGHEWRGYRIRSFDPKAEKLIVRKGKAEFAVALRSASAAGTIILPALLSGRYETLDRAVVYSADARVKLGDHVLFSPTGVMVSDADQKMVVGDLAVETESGTIRATDGVADLRKGAIHAKKMTFTRNERKTPGKSPEPTPTAVAPPGATEPREP